MPASSWIAHVKGVYAKGKSKGMSYKDALRAAAKTWKKGGKAKAKAAPEAAEDEKSAPAPRKRKRKRARPGPGPEEKNIN